MGLFDKGPIGLIGDARDWVRERMPPIPSPLGLASGAVDFVKSKLDTPPQAPADPAIVGVSGDTAGADGVGGSGGPAASAEAVAVAPPPSSYEEAPQPNVCMATSSAGPSNGLFRSAGSMRTMPATPNANKGGGLPPAPPPPESVPPSEWGKSWAPSPDDSFIEELKRAVQEGAQPQSKSSPNADVPEGETVRSPPPGEALPEPPTGAGKPPAQGWDNGFKKPGDVMLPPKPASGENGAPGEGDLDLNIPRSPKVPSFGRDVSNFMEIGKALVVSSVVFQTTNIATAFTSDPNKLTQVAAVATVAGGLMCYAAPAVVLAL